MEFEPLAIELGDLSITSATPLGNVVWFIVGLLLLTGLTLPILRWHRRSRPDPFI